MKLAYVTVYDSSDMNSWSGLGYYIHRTLCASNIQVEKIDNLIESWRILSKTKQSLYSHLWSKNYRSDRDPRVLKSFAHQVKKALEHIECDVVFSPGTIPIAYLETDKPIVFWADAAFAGMVDFYPNFTNLCDETIRRGNEMEQSALSRCRLAIYSSEWAANTAMQNYHVDPAKVKVVPFGANIESHRQQTDIARIAASKTFDVCKLLFVGVDWIRKGGDIALSVCQMLNQQGIKTELHVVGCEIVAGLPQYVMQYGFVSKTTEQGRKLLNELFTQSHFFVLPARAECFGIDLRKRVPSGCRVSASMSVVFLA